MFFRKVLLAILDLIERRASAIWLMPCVILLLAYSIFPLIVSFYLSLTRFKLVQGGWQLKYLGWLNYKKLFFGSQQYHFLGTFESLNVIEWFILLGTFIFCVYRLTKFITGKKYSIVGLIGRLIFGSFTIFLVWLSLLTIGSKTLPGSLVITLIYLILGVIIQLAIGLLLAVICTQKLKGTNFFSSLFFIPLTVTPIGIAYAFRLVADTSKGPFSPIWKFFGLAETAWSVDPWSARFVVIIADSWQWIPLFFIVLLAALEGVSKEQKEAALVDGASSWQIFKDITLPYILPSMATVVLIRMIEAFKIIDLPNILTNGGPGIATESISLHAFIAWRTLDLGGSAAISYTLLVTSTILCVGFFNFVGKPARERIVGSKTS